MKSIIITIGRQFGSGGREVGRRVASALGVPFYDRELLAEAAERSGLTREMLESYDEQPTNSFLYSLSMGTYTFGAEWQLPLNNQVFLAMTEAIKSVAAKGSCVIVGRCAEYVLSDHPELVRVFIYGDLEMRVKRIMETENLSEREAASLIQKTDKRRSNYHNFYSDNKWGSPGSYDLLLNTTTLGLDAAADLLVHYAQTRQ